MVYFEVSGRENVDETLRLAREREGEVRELLGISDNLKVVALCHLAIQRKSRVHTVKKALRRSYTTTDSKIKRNTQVDETRYEFGVSTARPTMGTTRPKF